MELFELAEERERQWDAVLERLPECTKCGRRIAEDTYFQYENICLCGRCVDSCTVLMDVDW